MSSISGLVWVKGIVQISMLSARDQHKMIDYLLPCPLSMYLSWVYISVKRHHDHGNSYKGKHLTGAGLEFRGLVHDHHVRKHNSMQADMGLEKELGVLHPNP